MSGMLTKMLQVVLLLALSGAQGNIRAESFYCSALAIEGDLYYFSPVFEGHSEQLECYTTALDDYLEHAGQYSFSPACMFEDEEAMLLDHYRAEMADSEAIFGGVKVLDWVPATQCRHSAKAFTNR